MKKLVSLLCVAALALSLFACPLAIAESELEPVELIWYISIGANRTFTNYLDAIKGHIDEYLKDKLNVKLDLRPTESETFNATMPAMLASGAEMDIVGISGTVDYQNFARANAFVKLDEMLPVYAPVTYNEIIPAAGWDAVRVDGSIFAVLPMKDWAQRGGLIYNTTLCEDIGYEIAPGTKYGKSIETVDMMYEAKALRDAKYPELAGMPIGSDAVTKLTYDYLYERLIGSQNLACINISGHLDMGFAGYGENEVFCGWDTEEYRSAAKLHRQLILDSIIPEDPTSFNVDGELNQHMFGLGYPTGHVKWDTESYLEKNGIYTDMMFSEISLVTGAYVRNGLQSISVQSKNPERALMFLEEVNSGSEIITTLAFGIEGQNWTDEDQDGVLEHGPLPKETWFIWYPWMYGTITNVRVVPPGYTPDFPQLIFDLNQESIYSNAMGFTFNSEPVANLISACDSIHPEYTSMIDSGMYDNTDELIDEMIEKLNANGLQEIIAEVQRQLDVYNAAL